MAIHVVGWGEAFPAATQNGAASVGNFDGVHAGHAALLRRLADDARAVAGPAVVVTFDPHPLAVLRPERAPALLTARADRAELLHALGADHVVELRATPALFEQRAADFFAAVLRDGLGVRALAEGPNFAFGRGREGDLDLLRRLCADAGVALAVVPPVVVEGAEVSSSRARAALLAGDVRAAAAQLGRHYVLRGVVGTGERRGRTIGFPTANLTDTATVVPGDGVYAAFALLDGAAHAAAVNVGGNPTFGQAARKIEAHLIGFGGDLVGRPLALAFVRRLRPTRAFPGPAELVEQLGRDVAAAREALADARP